MLDYLAIASHPDDIEVGMGATVVRLIQQGASVGILDLTNGEPTPQGSPEIRARETAAATEVLGVDWRDNLGLPNRSLMHTLEARKAVAEVIRLQKPRVLFAPYWHDAHPDHVQANELIDAARFWAKLTNTDMAGDRHYPDKIIYYFAFHLRLHAQPSFVLDVSDQLDAKLKALECYHSQFVEGRPTEPPTFLDGVRDTARYWGSMIGVKYGEPFRTKELVGLSSLQDVL